MRQQYIQNKPDRSNSAASIFSRSDPSFFFSSGSTTDRPFFSPTTIQPRLKVGRPNDKYEQEADRVADAVVSSPEPEVQRQVGEEKEENMLQMQPMNDREKEEDLQLKPLNSGAPLLQRKCTDCENEEKLQKKAEVQSSGSGKSFADNKLNSRLKSSAGRGGRLPGSVQSEMSRKMGTDFSGVSVHTDSKSVQMNRQLGAKAFTYGSDIYFNKGQYQPETTSGKHLLAHELTHVVQQGGAHRMIQRHVLEDDPLTAPPMSCTVANTSPAGTSLDITFSSNSSALTPLDMAAVDNFVNNWHASGASDPVRIDGFASIDGGPALNWPLSCDRAQILANELMTPTSGIPGIPAAFVDIFANGETNQFSTALAPNRRATATVPIPPPAATGAVFSESAAQIFHGYDNSVTPNFQIIPVGETRIADVAVTPAGAAPTFVSNDPSVVTVRPTATGIEVTGVADGTARIEARQGTTVLGTLRIEVKSQRDITVDYHFMSDTARVPSFFGLIPGAPQHSTTRVPASAPGLTATLNRIWQRQANVQFTTGTVDSQTVPSNLGAQIAAATNAAPEWRAVSAFSTGGDWNVFLVWEFELAESPGTDAANAGTGGSETLLEDNECLDALTIAHEAGHFLSGASLPHTGSGIMSGCGGAARRRVRKNEADAVNT